MRPSVLILFNNPGSSGSGAAWTESDAGVEAEVAAVAKALERLGIPNRGMGVSSLAEARAALAAAAEDVVFNLVEQLAGGHVEACLIPRACRDAGRRFTGADSECLSLCLDKARAKKAFVDAAVPTPGSVTVAGGSAAGVSALGRGLVIVKPAAADASEGIGADAVLDSGDPSLAGVIRRVRRLCGGPVLVESYVDGREVNVSLLEMGGSVRVLPVAEIEFLDFPPGKPRIVDYAAKWKTGSFEYRHTARRVPAEFDGNARERIGRTALEAWSATGCSGYARVDFRIALDGTPFVLEVNPNPDISPDAGFAAALEAGGVSYCAFVEAMVGNAMERAPDPSQQGSSGD